VKTTFCYQTEKSTVLSLSPVRVHKLMKLLNAQKNERLAVEAYLQLAHSKIHALPFCSFKKREMYKMPDIQGLKYGLVWENNIRTGLPDVNMFY